MNEIVNYAQNGGGFPMGIILVVGMIAIFYFLVIRPQTKRRKEHQALVNSLNRGDEIVTAGGIMGTISRVEDEWVQVSVDNNTSLRLQKGSITASLPKGTLKNIDP